MHTLLLRTLTGAAFVLTLVGCIVASQWSFALLFALITGLCLWEFTGLMNRHYGAQLNRMITTVGGVYLFLAFFYYCSGFVRGVQEARVFVPCLVMIVYLPISELYLRRPDPLRNWALSLAAMLYVALPFGLLNALAYASPTLGYNWAYPLALFLFLWMSDTGAYCCGSLLGRLLPAPLFPRVSPHKTWVGSVGGGVLCLLVAVALWHWMGGLSLPGWMGLGLTTCILGTWGDLVESLLKRQLGIKDSGRVLPGHGGMLDRFDSMLMAAPGAVLYLYTIMSL